jgi:hypothetical protein
MFVSWRGAPQIPPLRYPEFPVEVGSVGELHAAFFKRKPDTRLCEGPGSRKSLRSGRDDKSEGGLLTLRWLLGWTEKQVPSLGSQ